MDIKTLHATIKDSKRFDINRQGYEGVGSSKVTVSDILSEDGVEYFKIDTGFRSIVKFVYSYNDKLHIINQSVENYNILDYITYSRGDVIQYIDFII